MFEDKEYSPYRGLLVSCFMMCIFPILLMALFSFILRKELLPSSTDSIYTPIFFGSLCGNGYHIILILVGTFNKPFMIEANRIKNFFSDWDLSFKLAVRELVEDIKENKMIFWIYFSIMLFFIILTIISYNKIMN